MKRIDYISSLVFMALMLFYNANYGQKSDVSTSSQKEPVNWNTVGFQQANTMGAGKAPVASKGKFRVFVLMGQSNMQGAGKAKDLKAPYTKKHERIRIWANGQWEYFVPTRRHGPGVSFAHQLAAYWPDDTIGIIKVASGGTGICGFEKDWSYERAQLTYDGKKGSLYKDLMNAVTEAKRISNPEFCGFFWKQGAADGSKKVLADAYYERLEQLIADIRADLNAPELPVFIPSYKSDEGMLKIVASKMPKEAMESVFKSANKTPENATEKLELLFSYLEKNNQLKGFGKRSFIVKVIMEQNRAGREMTNVTTLYPGELPRIGGGNEHYNSEGYVLLGKKTAATVEEFYNKKKKIK